MPHGHRARVRLHRRGEPAMTVPPEAVTAAALAINGELGQKFSPGGCRLRQIADAALEAAATAIAAAERDRIAREILAQRQRCPLPHHDQFPKPSCVTCARNGAFHRAARIAAGGHS